MVESSCITLNPPTFLDDKHFKNIEVGGNEVDDAKKRTVQLASLLKCAQDIDLEKNELCENSVIYIPGWYIYITPEKKVFNNSPKGHGNT